MIWSGYSSRLVWLFAMLLWPAAAQAAWLQASSAHFVIYADDSEANLRRFADKLERYHAAMELVTRQKTPPLSPSNRVTVYIVKSAEEVRELAKTDDWGVAAFYVPRAGGSLAVVPPQGKPKDDEEGELDPLIPLLHEYAHHFLISTSSFPMPRWFSEGAAEFFASASFKSDGGMGLGQPAAHRVEELSFANLVRAREVLDDEDGLGGRYAGFYAKSWQLYHYLIFEPKREGQLAQYLAELAAGNGSLEAAQKVFGDLDVLEAELDEYAKRKRLSFFAVPPTGLKPGPVAVKALTPGAAAVIGTQIRLRLTPEAEQVLTLLDQAQKAAAQFPGDPAVLDVLAAAEYAADNDKDAIAAADKAIAADPGEIDAYVQKGLALFRIAETADDGPAAFDRARQAFAALSEREPDHPLPLVYFFRSYLEQGQRPPPLAMEKMQRAVDLAPFDLNLRLNLALAQERLGQAAEARDNLLPVAHNPHGGDEAAEARKILARLDVELAPKAEGPPK